MRAYVSLLLLGSHCQRKYSLVIICKLFIMKTRPLCVPFVDALSISSLPAVPLPPSPKSFLTLHLNALIPPPHACPLGILSLIHVGKNFLHTNIPLQHPPLPLPTSPTSTYPTSPIPASSVPTSPCYPYVSHPITSSPADLDSNISQLDLTYSKFHVCNSLQLRPNNSSCYPYKYSIICS